ncbi:MAG: hypothetical protein HYU39_10550 [Thaumarchaeota archaeon]|nr:hypothetical protein [Nitrososphaerota archaeon]
MTRYPTWIRSCVLCQRWRDGECIPASAMWGDKKRLDELVLQLTYRRPLERVLKQQGKRFEEVEAGRRAHLALEQRRHVLRRLSDLVEKIKANQGKPIPFTCRACSRFYGQRSQPDALYLNLQSSNSKGALEVTIVEDKHVFRPTYMLQLYAMGLIFSDPYVMVQRPVSTSHTASDIEDIFMDDGILLYDYLKDRMGLEELRVNVYISLNAYVDAEKPKDEPLFRALFSSDFKLVPEMEKAFLSTRRRRNIIIKALEKKKPYLIPTSQTHFTTRPRKKSKIVEKLDDKFFLYLPKTG